MCYTIVTTGILSGSGRLGFFLSLYVYGVCAWDVCFESVLCNELTVVVTDGVEFWELTFCVVPKSDVNDKYSFDNGEFLDKGDGLSALGWLLFLTETCIIDQNTYNILKDPTNVLGFMVVILLHIGHLHVSATHVAIFRVVRTRIPILRCV